MISTRSNKRIGNEEVFDNNLRTNLELLNGIGKEYLLKSIPSVITAIKQPGYETAYGVISVWLQNKLQLRDSIISKLNTHDGVVNISSSLAFAEFILTNSELLFVERTKMLSFSSFLHAQIKSQGMREEPLFIVDLAEEIMVN